MSMCRFPDINMYAWASFMNLWSHLEIIITLMTQVPSRVEPVLADKEVLLTALNIKAMSFVEDDEEIQAQNKLMLERKSSLLGKLISRPVVNHVCDNPIPGSPR